MRERELRSVLLIKAIEDGDPHGELLPIADRTRATRETQRAGAQETDRGVLSPPGALALPEPAERLLAQRAARLRERLALRYPVVEEIAAAPLVPAGLQWLVLALSAALGLSLSALDGSRRINILAFPLLGLIAWNVAVYVFLIARRLRTRDPGHGRMARGLLGRARRAAQKASRFNAALAGALGKFATEWTRATAPVLALRASRVFHLGAALVGAGLILGLYVRGIALRYEAGWESTFLGAAQVHTLISLLYAPAAALTGVALPDLARLEAMRWDAGRGGENAAPWIHLLSATVVMWVVIPRAALALIAALKEWRAARALRLPGDAVTYFRAIFAGAQNLVGQGETLVVPYAYAPSTNALAMLRTVLSSGFGGVLSSGSAVVVPYGEEDTFLAGMSARVTAGTQVVVLLFSLATTPEEENHGTLLGGVRDWITREAAALGLLVVVDEGPYPTTEARRAERRGVWRAFVSAHGLQAYFADLSADLMPEEAGQLPLWRATRP